MKIGYARVSTDEQTLDVQIAALAAAGCARIFRENVSGKNTARPELQRLLTALEAPVHEGGTYAGDGHVTVVVAKLDRLARNTRDLLEIVERIGKAGAGLVSLSEPWADTTSPAGKLIMTVFAGIAQFERERILERTSEGRAHAKQRGVRFGRPGKLSKERQREALRMLKDGSAVKAVARVFQVDPSTIRRMQRGA